MHACTVLNITANENIMEMAIEEHSVVCQVTHLFFQQYFYGFPRPNYGITV